MILKLKRKKKTAMLNFLSVTTDRNLIEMQDTHTHTRVFCWTTDTSWLTIRVNIDTQAHTLDEMSPLLT